VAKFLGQVRSRRVLKGNTLAIMNLTNEFHASLVLKRECRQAASDNAGSATKRL
jgi:hypothetical protein